jgi:hypothetical protein
MNESSLARLSVEKDNRIKVALQPFTSLSQRFSLLWLTPTVCQSLLSFAKIEIPIIPAVSACSCDGTRCPRECVERRAISFNNKLTILDDTAIQLTAVGEIASRTIFWQSRLRNALAIIGRIGNLGKPFLSEWGNPDTLSCFEKHFSALLYCVFIPVVPFIQVSVQRQT